MVSPPLKPVGRNGQGAKLANLDSAVKLLSVNVGLPGLLKVHGREAQTGIRKKPAAGPVAVRTLNLEGDGQADLTVHGGPDKAIYLYPWENTRYWQSALVRPKLGPGAFGENLTTEGLSETQVAIGDEFAIGTARFLVTQPRQPCAKLALILETPSITQTLLETGRTGFYLRVLQEGIIQAGDPIYPLPSRESVRVTIAEIVECYRHKSATPAQAAQILRLAALPENWKKRFRPA
jgi:MOSC domain-containing protein YiiM